jgi:undecaprenyl-diphosphatase
MGERWVLAAVTAFGLFGLLALMVSISELPAVDRYAMSVVPHWYREQGLPIAKLVTTLGDLWFVALISVPLGLWLAVKRARDAQLFLLAFVASPLNSVIKESVGRPRPDAGLFGFSSIIENNLSFPSGHAALAAGFYGVLIILARRTWPPSPARTALTAVLGLAIALVALSRVYLGVHYPTDTLGGLLLAGGWLAVIVWLDGRRDEKRGRIES